MLFLPKGLKPAFVRLSGTTEVVPFPRTGTRLLSGGVGQHAAAHHFIPMPHQADSDENQTDA